MTQGKIELLQLKETDFWGENMSYLEAEKGNWTICVTTNVKNKSHVKIHNSELRIGKSFYCGFSFILQSVNSYFEKLYNEIMIEVQNDT